MLGEGDMNGGQKEVVGVLAATAAKKGPARLEQGVAQFVLALQNYKSIWHNFLCFFFYFCTDIFRIEYSVLQQLLWSIAAMK